MEKLFFKNFIFFAKLFSDAFHEIIEMSDDPTIWTSQSPGPYPWGPYVPYDVQMIKMIRWSDRFIFNEKIIFRKSKNPKKSVFHEKPILSPRKANRHFDPRGPSGVCLWFRAFTWQLVELGPFRPKRISLISAQNGVPKSDHFWAIRRWNRHLKMRKSEMSSKEYLWSPLKKLRKHHCFWGRFSTSAKAPGSY